MQILPLSENDFLDVEELIRNTLLEINSQDYSDHIIQGMLTVDPFRPRNTFHERQYFVSKDPDIIWIIGVKENEVKTFFVDVNHRGKGVWKKLLDYAHRKILENGFGESVVYSSVSARGFYEKNGYIIIREDLSDMSGESMLRYYLEKDLIDNRWSFWGDKYLAEKLLSLVLNGLKTATTGLYVNNEPHWKVGEYAIIFDEETWKDLCIIEYTKVEILPFLDVEFEYIRKEGEWDKDIESWRKSHRQFYYREYPEIFTDDSMVVCEEFRPVKIL